MDPALHRRFLDYREAFEYFGRAVKRLTPEEFAPLDAEFRVLDRMREGARTREEQARHDELARILLRD